MRTSLSITSPRGVEAIVAQHTHSSAQRRAGRCCAPPLLLPPVLQRLLVQCASLTRRPSATIHLFLFPAPPSRPPLRPQDNALMLATPRPKTVARDARHCTVSAAPQPSLGCRQLRRPPQSSPRSVHKTTITTQAAHRTALLVGGCGGSGDTGHSHTSAIASSHSALRWPHPYSCLDETRSAAA